MSFANFIARIRLIADEIEESRAEQSFIIAKEIAEQVRVRVQKQKVNADGASFGSYSTAVVPRWMLEQKATTKGAKDTIASGSWFQSYSDLRQAQGLQTENVDFTFTGRMWNEIGVNDIQESNNSTTVRIGGVSEYAKMLLGYQEPKYGNIIRPSEEEEQRAADAHRDRILNIISKYL